MNSIAFLGLQWGNEGKSKITDAFSQEAHYIVKYQGGNTIIRSVKINDKYIDLRIIDSTLLSNRRSKLLIASGTVLNIHYLMRDIKLVKEFNPNINEQILIDGKVNIIMPYHIKMDAFKERTSAYKIGTTLNGVGPTYEDKFGRCGIRFVDLFDKDVLYEKIKIQIALKIRSIKEICDDMNIDKIFEKIISYTDILKPMLVDGTLLLNQAIGDNRNVLFEASQSVMLDIDHGTYPYVTSSSPTAGAISANTGIPPHFIKDIVGIFKSYSTRMGNGFFPSEIQCDEEVFLKLNKNRHLETKEANIKSMRCGYLDIPQLRYAIMINGITKLVLTKLDILTGIGDLKIVKSYTIDRKEHHIFSSLINGKKIDKLNFIELEGWDEDISGIKDFKELPKACKKFISTLEDLLNFPISIISTSNEKACTIVR